VSAAMRFRISASAAADAARELKNWRVLNDYLRSSDMHGVQAVYEAEMRGAARPRVLRRILSRYMRLLRAEVMGGV